MASIGPFCSRRARAAGVNFFPIGDDFLVTPFPDGFGGVFLEVFEADRFLGGVLGPIRFGVTAADVVKEYTEDASEDPTVAGDV